jgi:acetylornithine deacetylase/succinyl-diaminopimelate desuccinylase-like protein
VLPADYLKLLQEFVSIKSISTNPKFKEEVNHAAQWLKDLLTNYGFTAELLPGKETNSVVFGEYIADPSFETILVYGHYDVQPAEKKDGWQSEPFAITEKGDRLYGRGAIDNKGQVLVHIYTVGELIKAKKLKYNVKFLVEGNEETGNEEMADLIRTNKEKLSCDYVMISDGETVDDRPTLDVGLRGGGNLTLKYKTAKTNLHSGIYGGAVPNPAHEMSKLIAKFYDDGNKVTIPGFYDNVEEATEAEIANNKSMPFDLSTLEKLTEAKALKTETGYDFYTQTGLRPMMTVTGFKSGYIDEGYANIVPAEAEIRVNFRFVMGQDPEKMFDLFEKFVADNTADYVTWSLEKSSRWRAVKIDVSQPKVKEVLDLMEKAYGSKPAMKFVGGSIPAILDFKEVLGKDTISVSMANEDCNMHGVDENFKVELAEKGLKFSEMFFSGEK